MDKQRRYIQILSGILFTVLILCFDYFEWLFDHFYGDNDGVVSRFDLHGYISILQALLLVFVITYFFFKSGAANALLSTFSVMFLFLMIEGGARVYFKFHPKDVAWHFMDVCAYKEAPYYNQEFIKENDMSKRFYLKIKSGRLLLPGDFHGKYMNISNTFRRVCQQPDSFKHTIYFFGGSTAFCGEVPDSFTSTSYLQYDINEAFPNSYKVVNCGVISFMVREQMERLKLISLKPGDKIIFYDGFNDVFQVLFRGETDRSMLESLERKMEKANVIFRIKSYLYNKLGSISYAGSQIFYPYSLVIPPHIQDKEKANKYIAKILSNYRNALDSTIAICNQNKVGFYHFLQPTLFSKAQYSECESNLMQDKRKIFPGMKEAFEFAYPILEKNIFNTNNSYIIKNCFKEPQDIYFDYCHVNNKGNKIIADSIFKILKPKLLESNNPVIP